MRRLSRLLVVTLLLGLAACEAEEVPDSPAAVEFPDRVTINVEYRQPNVCENVVTACSGDVVFHGSWMRPDANVVLRPQPGSFIWTATISGVPVNFPPDDLPYFVRVFDPYLWDTGTEGRAGRRIEVGGQALQVIYEPDTPQEAAGLYIDANGVGRNPF